MKNAEWKKNNFFVAS